MTLREVDNQLRIFQDLNTIMERTGEFKQAGKAGGSKEDLLKMVWHLVLRASALLSASQNTAGICRAHIASQMPQTGVRCVWHEHCWQWCIGAARASSEASNFCAPWPTIQVAKNNVMRTGILSSKIGLTKRFEAAWKDPECDRIYEHLRKEMEIDRRYDDLEVKARLRASPACPGPHGCVAAGAEPGSDPPHARNHSAFAAACLVPAPCQPACQRQPHAACLGMQASCSRACASLSMSLHAPGVALAAMLWWGRGRLCVCYSMWSSLKCALSTLLCCWAAV